MTNITNTESNLRLTLLKYIGNQTIGELTTKVLSLMGISTAMSHEDA